jgi:hypothetical protein
MKQFILILCVAFCFNATAQLPSVTLDSMVIVASAGEFDEDDFMKKVVADTSFYKAFKNLRFFPHKTKGRLLVYNRKDGEKGFSTTAATQKKKGNRMWVEIDEEKTNGKIKNRKGEYKYLTAEMYDEVFFPKDTAEVSNVIGDSFKQEKQGGGKIERHKSEMMIMMFNPGTDVKGIPMIGKKMSIFDKDMIKYYDYKIWLYDYKDSIPCYAFTVKAKPEWRTNATVIKELTSYFDQETMQVLKREYHLEYKSMILEFNIKMDVENENRNGETIAKKVYYEGFWDLPAKKAENIVFALSFSDYDLR